MREIKMRLKLIVLLAGLLSLGSVYALPVTTVDLDARVNGLSNTVNRLLDPGTYIIEAAGGTWDAWNAWGSATNCSNSNGCDRNGSKKYKGWLNIYSFASADLDDVTINGSSATPDGDRYVVNPRMAYPDAISALAHAWVAEFTLHTTSTLKFAITDGFLSDNLGGMSLNVSLKDVLPSATIPKPTGLALFALAGLVGAGISKRKKV